MRLGFPTGLLATLVLMSLSSCRAAEVLTTRPVTVVGHIDHKTISESSGIVASRRHPGVYWTHNDSDNGTVLYAITSEGKLIVQFPVVAGNDDWEDIAIDDRGQLYIGDVGDNGGKKKQMIVYRVDEPDVSAKIPDRGRQPALKPTAIWRIDYPGESFDCESLFVYRGYGYVIPKSVIGAQAVIYRFPLAEQKGRIVLERVVVLPIRSPVTAADISADGNRLAVLTVTGLNVFLIQGDVVNAGRVTPSYIRLIHPRIEACCFASGGVLATAETREVFLFAEKAVEAGNQAMHQADLAEPLRLSLRELARAPAVDGQLSEWDFSRHTLPLQAAHPIVEGQPVAYAWAGWRKEGLYIAGRVPAGNLSPLRNPWFMGDTIEIFVGREGGAAISAAGDRLADYGEGDDRCYLGFGRNPDGSCGALQIHWPRRESSPPAGARAAGCINADQTYQFEVFIPASVLAFPDLVREAKLRLNLSILSHRPRRNWYLSSSNSSGCWVSPLKWAVVTMRGN